MKTCKNPNCIEANPQSLTRFYNDKGFADGKMAICKTCKSAKVMKWREDNRHKYNSSMRDYNALHYQKHRLRRYKLSPEQHARMLLDQKGVCAICKKLPGGKRPLVVDHDHDSKEVRGLLCYGCNRAIHILDKPELLEAALIYLKINQG